MFNKEEYNTTKIEGKVLFYKGNSELLNEKPAGIFASREMPLSLYPSAEKLISAIAELRIPFISGWLSPFERRILQMLSLTGNNLIFFTSKGIKNQMPFPFLDKPFREGKALILSLFEENPRISSKNSINRNQAASDIAAKNLFIYIKEKGNLQRLFERSVSKGKNPFVFKCRQNSPFLTRAKGVDTLNYKDYF